MRVDQELIDRMYRLPDPELATVYKSRNLKPDLSNASECQVPDLEDSFRGVCRRPAVGRTRWLLNDVACCEQHRNYMKQYGEEMRRRDAWTRLCLAEVDRRGRRGYDHEGVLRELYVTWSYDGAYITFGRTWAERIAHFKAAAEEKLPDGTPLGIPAEWQADIEAYVPEAVIA